MSKKTTIIHCLIAAITVLTVKAEIALIDLRSPETKTIKALPAKIAGMKKHQQMQMRKLLPPPPTLTLTIPTPIPEYSGTYEDFGQNHLFYPNYGQIRYNDEEQSTAIEEVVFYTQYTFPQKYILKNCNISFLFEKDDPSQNLFIDSLHRFDMEMVGSNATAFPARVDSQNTAVLNYFTDQFGSAGLVDVRGSAAVGSQSIWSNIDMVYTSNNTGMKIYYIVYPGGDPNDIVIHFNGPKSSAIVGNDLVINANWDGMSFLKPKMYQYTLSGGIVTPVNICNASWQSYTGAGPDTYSIYNATSYSASLPLIVEISQGPATGPDIDGVCWSTYFGGGGDDLPHKTHTDANNNLFVCGITNSANFPGSTGGFQAVNGGNTDGFISKFNGSGLLQWSTFVGGSASESINDFDFKSGSVLCVGSTGSSNLPTTTKTGAFNDNSFGGVFDGFILSIGLLSNGSISKDWLTYFGGNSEDDLWTCKFDGSGNLFTAGWSASSNLTPTGSGMYRKNFNTAQLAQSSNIVVDGLILRFNTSLDTSWVTFYGTDTLGLYANSYSSDFFYRMDISGGDVFVCGKAGGTNLPGSINAKNLNGSFDGIITHFTTGGVLSGARFVNCLSVNAIKLYNSGVYFVGDGNFAMSLYNSNNYYFDGTCSVGDQDACFGIYSTNLAVTYHQSFLGGSSNEWGTGLEFGANGTFYITGGTASSNFPVTSVNTFTATPAGGIDDFVTAITYGNTALYWSTCLGSPSTEGGFIDFPAITLDGQNTLHLFGRSNSTNTFPLDYGGGIPYFQGSNAGGSNGTDDCTITCFDLSGLNILLGIEGIDKTQVSIGIYPNPVQSSLIVSHPELTQGDLSYTIYDLSGKQLGSGQLKEKGQKTISVSFLKPGVYIISIVNGTRVFNNKFVKVEQ